MISRLDRLGILMVVGCFSASLNCKYLYVVNKTKIAIVFVGIVLLNVY